MTIILSSLIEGIKNVWTTKFLIGIMFVFKLISSLIIVLPLYLMFSTSFAVNVKASNFLAGFDPSLLIDFVYYWRRTLSIYFLMFILMCIVVVVLFIFLSGGFWGILRDQVKRKGLSHQTSPSENRMEKFFGYCGKHFWGMFKIGLLMIPLYLFAFLLALIFMMVFGAVAGKGPIWELTSWRMIVRIVIVFVLFLWFNMTGDYLRIFLVDNHQDSFWIVARKAFGFILKNISSTLSLYFFLSMILMVAIFLYGGMYKFVSGTSPSGIFVFIAFLIHQIFVAFISFYRLIYYSSQLSLCNKVYLKEESVLD